MSNEELEFWGWDERWEAKLAQVQTGESVLLPARVLSQREDTYTLATAEGLRWAHPAGILFHNRPTVERPGVGDWVVVEPFDCAVTDTEKSVTVTHSVVDVLPRSACFVREAPGARGEAQLVATNVDKVFVVNPADDLNCSRIERFCVAIASGGATPAVILSKGDLVGEQELQAGLEQVRRLVPGLQVVSAIDANNMTLELREAFRDVLQAGETYALVGASGVGKSTLVNALMGEDVQETGEVRPGDHKGRHVTSFRELFHLANGALLMDTPGVREFAIWSQGNGMSYVFADIEEMEENCRFSDCSHQTEPGCEVQSALAQGLLSPRRLQNWRSLKAEVVGNEERRERRESRQARSQLRRKVTRDKRFSRK